MGKRYYRVSQSDHLTNWSQFNLISFLHWNVNTFSCCCTLGTKTLFNDSSHLWNLGKAQYLGEATQFTRQLKMNPLKTIQLHIIVSTTCFLLIQHIWQTTATLYLGSWSTVIRIKIINKDVFHFDAHFQTGWIASFILKISLLLLCGGICRSFVGR